MVEYLVIVSSKLNSNEIVVGYDGRLTSPKLFKALSIGLKHAGSNVANIGMCPTPMVYFWRLFFKIRCGYNDNRFS